MLKKTNQGVKKAKRSPPAPQGGVFYSIVAKKGINFEKRRGAKTQRNFIFINTEITAIFDHR